jgi:hypothetical protein
MVRSGKEKRLVISPTGRHASPAARLVAIATTVIELAAIALTVAGTPAAALAAVPVGVGPAAVRLAAPGDPSASPSGGSALGPANGTVGGSSTGTDNEGGTPLLRDVLEAAGRDFVAAKARFNTSTRRQQQLTAQLAEARRRLDALSAEVGQIAALAYRTGRLGPVSALLNSASPDQLLQRAAAVELLTIRDDRKLHELNTVRESATRAKTAIDVEARQQQRQLAIMSARKREAERALVAVGGASTGGYVNATSPVAKAAPRNADGSWPGQSCTVDDPTTSGCITARMLNAWQAARTARFDHFVSCFRSGGPFEHPKGRACDFAAAKKTFGGVASGADRIYGNNLAAFFVRNADRLGVLYVIWFKQIWFPATGWSAYLSGGGDPASDHTNHVHLSVL